MNCSGLAFTGSPLDLVVVLATVLLGVGVLLLFAARRRRGATALALILLVNAVLGVGLGGGSTAHAATTCTAAASTVSVAQIAPITGIAPGAAAVPVVGAVTNKTDQQVFVVAVTVVVASVTKARGAAVGACDPSDYVVSNATTPVNKLLAPFGTLTFSGASIGFNDKSTDQDACEGAKLKLAYSTS
jgi:hypothetical protein